MHERTLVPFLVSLVENLRRFQFLKVGQMDLRTVAFLFPLCSHLVSILRLLPCINFD